MNRAITIAATDVVTLAIELFDVNDLDTLLQHVLSAARKISLAEAGSIYIREGNLLRFSAIQNDSLTGRKHSYSTAKIPIDHQSIVGHVAATGSPLTINDAYNLPQGVPFVFDAHYDQKSGYKTQSIMTLPIVTNRRKVIGVIQLINCQQMGIIVPFEGQLEPMIKFLAKLAASAIEKAQLTRDNIMQMVRVANLRDPKETGQHAIRVATYAALIYDQWVQEKWMIEQQEAERVRDCLIMAAMLHDIGKVAISDAILKKPAKLDENEFEQMKKHTTEGAKLFLDPDSELEAMAKAIALGHHERYDGRGYPDGLIGEEIDIFARITALADVYDALMSRRVYKDPWPRERVLAELIDQSGKQFDPEIITAFMKADEEIEETGRQHPEE